MVLPRERGLFYGGQWHRHGTGGDADVRSPATGGHLCTIAHAGVDDAHAAIEAARAGFAIWRHVPPMERAKILREAAAVVRRHGRELAMLDAADCGNPFTELLGDVAIAAGTMEFFAGLVTEMKGASIPMGPDAVNFSVREPRGVVARIIPFNHPFMFCAGRAAAPLAAGNSIIIKPPEQAPLSALRLAELIGGLFPPGVFNILPGGRDVGAALTSHPHVAMAALIGSVPTGRAVMRAAADTIKPVLLELGGKNALIACADADPDVVASAVVAGMNFAWCGQSCGSTSRAFLHEDIHDAVIAKLAEKVGAFRPGLPTNPATTMGAIASRQQYDRILDYIEIGKAQGARLVSGGSTPGDAELAGGWFIEPTIFADVTQDMRIASEEIFGPVLSLLRWSDEASMLEQVNRLDLGLTCSIWTNNLTRAHRLAMQVEAGFVWINETSKHFLGAPFGGYKQSGLGREECLDELLAFTQQKNIHVNLQQRV
ncbi:aldehyde dehydrogenase [Sphingomonas sp. SRS2]|nr:aldehyde dehydrogenase [Sphingomonas sp. SRS2]